jgi:hypothetical protein
MTEAATTNGSLALPLPDFSEDLAGIVYPPPRLTPLGIDGTHTYQFEFNSETGGRYSIERSTNLLNWTPFLVLTNNLGDLLLTDSSARTNASAFFRAKQNQ